MKFYLVTTALLLAILSRPSQCAFSEEELKNFLENEYEEIASAMCTRIGFAEWEYNVDIANTEKEEFLLNVTLEFAAFDKDYWDRYFNELSPDDYEDEQLRRQARSLALLGDAALDERRLTTLATAKNLMQNIYSTGKICPYTNQQCDLATEGLSLSPEIEGILAQSRDYDELAYVWKAWRDASGAKMKDIYYIYVLLSNQAAVLNNFQDKGELWRSRYDVPNFVEDIDALWYQVEPLYLELHKYVGNKLKQVYGDQLDISDGFIPAHVFGNMWAQNWNNIANIVKPFPNASTIDVDAALLEQGYTILDMFETADDFYLSLGLLPDDICYNTSAGAMIEKPSDREVVCHASAWDFCDGQNYRVKMCTRINFQDFTTIHHEMGHIQYYLQYAHQPYLFRGGANSGFHEAVGDTIALSVSTPKHLEKIGLLQNYEDDYEAGINTLMDMALEKVAFLPFGLLIDKWRWDVFSGAVEPEQWNSHWWQYRQRYQKVKAPVDRDDNVDFDPGAKQHIPGDYSYIAYFVSHILQFQFYKSLCIAAGEYDPYFGEEPLYKCDFYESKAAGDILRDGLSLGSSKHWRDTLELMTGDRDMDALAVLEYFEPLYQFLVEENSKNLH